MKPFIAWLNKKTPLNFTYLDICLYFLILTACAIFFVTPDLFYTQVSSYAFLRGHFLDFYDYNLGIAGGNDYFPILYFIFALWNLPLKILGWMTLPSPIVPVISISEMIWGKLLLASFFFATAIVIKKVAAVISNNSEEKTNLSYFLFLTSPIALFAVVIFCQYDILGLFFTMIGFYYYCKKDYRKFSWFFSFAIPFKFFALVIYIPLLLLSEKRFLAQLKHLAIASFFTLFQVLLFSGSSAFKEEAITLASNKMSNLAEINLSLLSNTPVLFVIYLLVCLYAYIKDPSSEEDRHKTSIFLCITSYSIMLICVPWHPQWFIIIMPFFALSHLYIKNHLRAYLLDVLGMLAFIWIVVNNWAGWVDVTMVSFGTLRQYFTDVPFIISDLMVPKHVKIFETIFLIYLFSPMLIYFIEKRNVLANIPNHIHNNYFRSRFLLGLGTFLIPSAICLLFPISLILRLNPDYLIRHLKQGLSYNVGEEKFEGVFGDATLSQSFVAEENNLNAVSVKLSIPDPKPTSHFSASLEKDDGTLIYARKFESGKIKTDHFYPLRFPAISESKGKTFILRLRSEDGSRGNTVLVNKNSKENYTAGKLYLSQVELPGHLLFTLFYKK